MRSPGTGPVLLPEAIRQAPHNLFGGGGVCRLPLNVEQQQHVQVGNGIHTLSESLEGRCAVKEGVRGHEQRALSGPEQLLVDPPRLSGVKVWHLGPGADEVGRRNARHGLPKGGDQGARCLRRDTHGLKGRYVGADRLCAARNSEGRPNEGWGAGDIETSRVEGGHETSPHVDWQSEDRVQHRMSARAAEEGSVMHPDDWNHERAIEVIVAHLAGRLGDQRAAVTGRSVEPAPLETLARRVLGADRVVRAERRGSQSARKMVRDGTRLLNEPAESAFRVGGAGVEENPVAAASDVGVDAFADRACGVAASHRQGLDKQVGKRVEENGGAAGKGPRLFALKATLGEPATVPLDQVVDPPLDLFAEEPFVHRGGAELKKIPSPRFSTAGNHVGSSARSARSTSLSYSPSMSGVTASNRVNPTRATTWRGLWAWTTAAMSSQTADFRQACSGRRRAWKLGSIGTSSPKPSGAAIKASNSTCLTGRSLPLPLRRCSIAARTSASLNGASTSATCGFFFIAARITESSTMSRKIHRSCTAVSTAVPRSGRDNTLRTCGK